MTPQPDRFPMPETYADEFLCSRCGEEYAGRPARFDRERLDGGMICINCADDEDEDEDEEERNNE